MVNHLTNDSDVTAGYITLSAEKKMDAEQRMADAIDRLLTPPAVGNVIPIGASMNARKGGNHDRRRRAQAPIVSAFRS